MFEPSVYAARRRRLASTVSSGLILLLGNRESPMNAEANPYPFRQDSTMLYYTGLDESGLDAVIDADDGTATLYGSETDLETAVWMGPQPSLSERASQAGLSETGSPSDLADDLSAAVQNSRPVHFLQPYRDEHRHRLRSLLGIGAERAGHYASTELTRAVVAQRSVKSEAEIRELERAVASTAAIHEYAMSMARPGRRECEIAGLLSGLARSRGGELSFQPTCSVHGEVLHNHDYDNTMADGDLLLVDAGATSPMHYAGDITRVVPVGGSFDERQQGIYEAVLDAQETAIEMLEPGVPFREVHLHAAQVLTEHLIDLGLMSGHPDSAVEAGAHALFFPHGLGHMLGLDVHDMEALGEDIVGYADDQERSDQFGLDALRLARPLEAGFVVTVEPGCYFIPPLIRAWREEDRHQQFINYDAVADFAGFGGIRIEDDVLVTESGSRILGPRIPKSVDEVEDAASSS